eukprot:TRINITY_DN3625_c4_g1_i1.p1 TRINITY_DN3625_c4_g1~~TRINITY_DN3625_c4_g1_i1.p1  ORF type:complete len:444 (+),score=62.34 TRINITY_DN3625_c4_g1_i1:65-1396(+)
MANISDPALSKRVAVLSRVGKMLRRKAGHEREDKAYDKLMRNKTMHIIMFSMGGVVAMAISASVTWYTGEFRTDTTWDSASPTIKTVMLCLQLVVTLTTVVTICLIIQYYRLLLLNKRREWSKIDIEDASLEERRDIKAAYSLWKSGWLRTSIIAEVLVHVVHPLFVFQESSRTFFTLCQIAMFMRLYLFVRMLHTFSRPYKLRIEIVSSNREFQTMNLRIKMGLTLKMLFYSRTGVVLTVSFALVIAVFSFMIFLVERNEQRNEFGRLENVFWFSFITFTTIGFGDFVPKTISGRVLTVLLGISGVIITTIFSGVLTNKLAPTKVQRYVVEYLTVRDALQVYRKKAVLLIEAVYIQYSKRIAPKGHKGNTIYGAVKSFRRARFDVKGSVLPSMDPVLEDKLIQLKGFLRDLDGKLSQQQDQMRQLQDKVEYELAAILRSLSR